MGNKNNKNRKKRKYEFQGNRHTGSIKKTVLSEQASEAHQVEVEEDIPAVDHVNMSVQSLNDTVTSTSATKLNLSIDSTVLPESVCNNNFFFLFNFQIFKNILEMVGACKNCDKGSISLHHIFDERKGFSCKFNIKCSSCDWTHEFFSSSECCSFPEKSSHGQKTQEVNIRSMIAFREFGKGHEAMKLYATMMNMPPPMCLKSYNNLNTNLRTVYENVAVQSM